MELGEHRVKFAQTIDGRAVGHIGTGVAGGFKLAGAQDSFQERGKLVVVDGGARGWVRADHGRMRNWNSLLLQPASGVLNPTSHAGIFLAERPARKQEQDTRNCQILCKPLSFSHIVSMVLTLS